MQKIVTSHGSSIYSDGFGSSVCLSGELLAVGSPTDSQRETNSGAVHLFRRTLGGNWEQIAKLRSPDPVNFGHYGFAVALGRNHLLVGAPQEDVGGLLSGAAYLYELDSSGQPTLVDRLRPRYISEASRFGHSVSIIEGRAAVGAPHYSLPGVPAAGAVYVFEQDPQQAWTEYSRISLGSSQPSQRFGHSISLDGDLILVGAPGRNAYSDDDGAAYLFQRMGSDVWIKRDRFSRFNAASHQRYGWSVALEGSTALIGGPGIEGSSTGKVVYCRVDAARQLRLVELIEPSMPFDRRKELGFSVSLAGDLIALGAPGEDSHGWRTGAVVVRTTASLLGTPQSVSVGAGGVQTLDLVAGIEFAWSRYMVLGSFTGPAPGITLPGGLELPLRRDSYFLHTIHSPGRPPLERALGRLDARGHAEIRFRLPAGADPRLIGRSLQHVAIVSDPDAREAAFVSVPAILDFEP